MSDGKSNPDYHIKNMLICAFEYLTCPKTSYFLTGENLTEALHVIAFNNNYKKANPFKFGVLSALPYETLCLSMAANDHYKKQPVDLEAWSSIRHVLHNHFQSLVEHQSNDAMPTIWFEQIAKQEFIESVMFMLEEINENYEKFLNSYYLARKEMLS